MLELMNYTRDTATQYESGDTDEFQSYLDDHEGDEMGISQCSIIAINSLDEATKILAYDESQLDILQVVAEHCGYNYFDTLDEALEEIENIDYIRVDGASSLYDTAHKLDYGACYEDDLYMLLGCSSESYEQLGSYISTDDIANLLEREYTVVITSNSAIILL